MIDWIKSDTLDWDWVGQNLAYIGELTLRHAVLAVLPVLIALVVAVPLGYLVFRTGKGGEGLLVVLGVIYAIPALALFVLMPIFLTTKIVNPLNVVIALAVYSIALLVRSVVEGLRSVPDAVKESASGVGFGGLRRFVAVELPLAMPAIFSGLRVVTVSNIALVSIGVLIGVQQLGQLFDTGFNRDFYTPIIVGIVLTVLLAIIADVIILLVRRGALPWARGRRVA